MRSILMAVVVLIGMGQPALADDWNRLIGKQTLPQSDQGQQLYFSWVGDDVFPATRKLFEGIDREWLRRPSHGHPTEIRPRLPTNRAIKPYTEIEAESLAQNLFGPTQILFREDEKSNFRATFVPDYWDDQELQQLAITDADATRIEWGFPLSKKIDSLRQTIASFISGSITFYR